MSHIKHNPASNTLEASIKMFANDFEDALKKLYNQKIDLLGKKDTVGLNSLIQSYIANRFKLVFNQKPLKQQYIGFETEEEVIWIYLEYASGKNLVSLEIENSLLCDFINQQSNLIRLEYGGKEYHTRLNCPDKFALIKP